MISRPLRQQVCASTKAGRHESRAQSRATRANFEVCRNLTCRSERLRDPVHNRAEEGGVVVSALFPESLELRTRGRLLLGAELDDGMGRTSVL